MHRLNNDLEVKKKFFIKSMNLLYGNKHTLSVDVAVLSLVSLTVMKEIALFIQKLPLLGESGYSYAIILLFFLVFHVGILC